MQNTPKTTVKKHTPLGANWSQSEQFVINTHKLCDVTHRGHASFSDICGAWVGFGSGFGIGFTLLLTRSSPSRHPPFTQYPSPSRSLVRDGQTSPHKPRLVVPHSTCPSLSPSPPAHSFIIGPAVINTHTLTQGYQHWDWKGSLYFSQQTNHYSIP